MKIIIVNFSGREKGNCFEISQVVAGFHSADEVKCYNFCSLEVYPCGKCNYECFGRQSACPYQDDGVYKIYDDLTYSDFVYYVVPNYCDYPNANYFLFNERSQCYFQHRQELLNRYLAVPKKFIVVSNTGRDNFTQAFLYQVSEGVTPEILFLSARNYQKVSIAGDLMSSDEARRDVEKFCLHNIW